MKEVETMKDKAITQGILDGMYNKMRVAVRKAILTEDEEADEVVKILEDLENLIDLMTTYGVHADEFGEEIDKIADTALIIAIV